MSGTKRAKVDEATASQTKCINTIRVLGADMVQKANSGHPGAPMGCAPMAFELWTHAMKYSPKNPSWPNRDRFVLSNGHGCALLYTMLHLTGYEHPTMDELQRFRQLDAPTAGHPERHYMKGVEVTTGPLGQGIASAVGLAIAEKHLAATFNEKDAPAIVDNYTYVICGDGCLQEGVSGEACSLAGHLGLSKLIVLYDDNHITIDGDIDVSFTEDVLKRYESYGWNTLVVADGDNDISGIAAAIEKAKAQSEKPTIIKVRTTIGFGSANQGLEKVHGAPLGAADIAKMKEKFGFDPAKSFDIAPEVGEYFRSAVSRGDAAYAQWEKDFAAYRAKYPAKAKEFERRFNGELPENWRAALPSYTPKDGNIASRNSSEKVINAIAKILPELMGGSADLTGSNKTELKCTRDFQKATPDGRYLRYGVREHGMAALCNGLDAYGAIIPFAATFLNFAGYAAGAMRLSALSHHRVLYVMTHDSIGLGEDGPTHQPIETLPWLRAMPNMYVFRPADATEVVGSYVWAIESKGAPSTLCLSRQDLPCLEKTSVEGVAKGGYPIFEVAAAAPKGKVVLVSTGSEVYIAIAAANLLATEKSISATVVSMPCTRLFDEQPQSYRQTVFPEGVPVLSVEASSVDGWSRYSHAHQGMTSYGKSAPMKDLYSHFGFTAPNIADKGARLVEFYKGKAVPNLMGGIEW